MQLSLFMFFRKSPCSNCHSCRQFPFWERGALQNGLLSTDSESRANYRTASYFSCSIIVFCKRWQISVTNRLSQIPGHIEARAPLPRKYHVENPASMPAPRSFEIRDWDQSFECEHQEIPQLLTQENTPKTHPDVRKHVA